MTSRSENRQHDGHERQRRDGRRRAWSPPRLVRLKAGAAENGITDTTPDGDFSES